MATKTRKKYTPETKKHYVDMFITEHKKTNITQKAFAKKYNLARSTFTNWLDDNKGYMVKRTNSKPISQQNIEYYLNLFKQERKKTNIYKKDFAYKHGINVNTFNGWMRKNSHTLTIKRLTTQPEEINHIRIELYLQLKSEYKQLTRRISVVQKHIDTTNNKKANASQLNVVYNFVQINPKLT